MASLFLTHRRQVAGMSTTLLQRADSLEQSGELASARDYVQRYIQLRRGAPEAHMAQIRLAQLVDKEAQGRTGSEALGGKTQAVREYRLALGGASQEDAQTVRARLIELLLELERYPETERECLKYLERAPQDAAVRRAYSLALAGQVNRGELQGRRDQAVYVGEEIATALELNPGDIQLTIALARLYREAESLLGDSQRVEVRSAADREARADRLAQRMVEERAADPAAWLARFDYRNQYKLPGADEDLREALARGPDDLNVRLAAALHAQRQLDPARRTAAVEHYRHILRNIDANHTASWIGLGDYFAQDQQWQEAISTYRDGLEQLGDKHFALQGRLALAYVRANQSAEAERTLSKLDEIVESTSYAAPEIRFGRARERDLIRAMMWLQVNSQVDQRPARKAVDLLEQLVQGRAASSVDAWMLLGDGHRALRQWDAAATAYDKAFSLDPNRLDSRRKAATAWLAAAQPEQAIRRYEELLGNRASAEDQELWLALANARLQQQLRRSRGQRHWGAFDQAYERAVSLESSSAAAEPWRLALLRAERLLAELPPVSPAVSDVSAAANTNSFSSSDDSPLASDGGRREELAKLLTDVEHDFADDNVLLERLVELRERMGDREGADRVLNKLAALPGKVQRAVLVRSRIASSRGEHEAAEQLLLQRLTSASPSDQVEIRRELVRAAYGRGQVDLVRQRLRELDESLACDPEVGIQIAELALNEGDYDEVERCEKRLIACEGPQGTRWQYIQANRLIAQSTKPDDPRLIEADHRVQAILLIRPNWAAPFVLKGIIAERRGQYSEATAAYRQALDWGERRPLVFQRLAHLLRDNEPEVEKLLASMREQGVASTGLSELRIASAERAGDTARALALARAEVQRRPRDASAQFWLGRTLLQRYEPGAADGASILEEAKAAFAQAATLEPENIQARMGLFLFYLRAGDAAAARRELEAMANWEGLAPGRRAELQAQGLQLLGDRPAAEARYAEAIQLEPSNADYHLRFATFVAEYKPDLATRHLRECLRLDPKQEAAKRLLATLLFRQGGESQWRQAQDLLQAVDDRTNDDANLRLQANLLVQRQGSVNLERARSILEKIIAGPRVQPNDRILLARVLERLDQQPAATQQYLALVARDRPSPAHLVEFIDYLLRRRRWDEAQSWLGKLDGAAPASLAGLQLRTRALQGQGRLNQLDSVVQQFYDAADRQVRDDGERARLMKAIGDVCGSVGRHASAETWHRQAFAISPELFAGLAYTLARLDRKQEALEICSKIALQDASPRPAVVACELLLLGQSEETDFQAAEPLLTKALAAHPNDPLLLGVAASARYFQNRPAEGDELSRRALRVDPRNVVTLNNLATILGERRDRAEEALQLIDRALDIAGAQPALLDTKATILLTLDRADEALPLLESAASAPNPDPRFRLHLALAYHKVGMTAKSQEHWELALQSGLDDQVLTDSDRVMRNEVESALRGGNRS
ncbi:MAG: hypothetical protein U1A77_08385 [Pirellulales bacterium]